MNKTMRRILAAALSALLLVGGTVTALAVSGSKTEEPKTEPAAEAAELPAEEVNEKDETVYVLTGADGSVSKIIVSDWIRNELEEAQLTDPSELTDVENVKGDETCTVENGSLLWDARGNDIYYRGNADKELPVAMTVSYRLDGKSVSPDQLAGQSGRVTIRFDYENRRYETAEVDGKQEKIYVPFAVLTGLLLDNDTFRNVTVTNGKLINDGDRTAVVGIAFPGLQQDLAIDRGQLNIPDYVEISADAESFSLGMSFTVASNEVFSGVDVTKVSSLEDLTDKLSGLTEAFASLTDGMEQLCSGADTLVEGSSTISDGISQLSDGLNALTANNAALNGGAEQVFKTLLDTANQQLKAAGLELAELTIGNYDTVLTQALNAVSTDAVTAAARQKVEAAVRAQEEAIRTAVTQAVQVEVKSKVTAAVRQSVLEQVLAANEISADTYAALPEAQKSRLDSAVDTQMGTDTVKAAIQSKLEEQMASDTVKALINSKTEEQIRTLVEQNMASEEVQNQLQAGLAQAQAGSDSLRQLKSQLDSYNTFYQGLQAYTRGVSSAARGAAQLKDAMPAFLAGVEQLRDGAQQMLDGLKGVDLGQINIADLASRLKATCDAADHYRSFSGISEEMDGQVRFIYRTDSIGG